MPPSSNCSSKHAFGRKAGFLTLAAAGVLAAFCFDDPVRGYVLAHQEPALVSTMRFISHYTAWQWLMLGCVIVLAFQWKRAATTRTRGWHWTKPVLSVMIAASVAGLTADLVRGLTGRTRPAAIVDEHGWFGPYHEGRWLIGRWAYNGFPSGHTTTVTGLVVAVGLRRRRIGWGLACLPPLVGASRIWVGAHNFSDVVAGLALGTLIASWVHGRLADWSGSKSDTVQVDNCET